MGNNSNTAFSILFFVFYKNINGTNPSCDKKSNFQHYFLSTPGHVNDGAFFTHMVP